jgi:predicted nucleic acid-binding protein
VLSVVRRQVTGALLDDRRAGLALHDLVSLPATRYLHAPFAPRVWELRGNLTPYDAMYVALAEALDCALVTADARLARAPGIRCAVEVLPSAG